MKIQYTFMADLEDSQEILYQKYNRIYSRNDLNELHSKLKSDLINKESLKHIEKLLTNYKDALVSVLEEVEENRSFIESLLNSLNGAQKEEAPEEESVGEKTEQLVENVQQTEHSIEQLSNIINSLGTMGNNNEQTQPT